MVGTARYQRRSTVKIALTYSDLQARSPDHCLRSGSSRSRIRSPRRCIGAARRGTRLSTLDRLHPTFDVRDRLDLQISEAHLGQSWGTHDNRYKCPGLDDRFPVPDSSE